MEEINLKLDTDICEKNLAFKWSINSIARIPCTVKSKRFALVDGESKNWFATADLLPGGQFKVSLAYDDKEAVTVRIEHFSRATDSKGGPLGGISSGLILFQSRCEMVLLDKIRLPEVERPEEPRQETAIFECAMKIYGCGLVTTCDVFSEYDAPNMDVVGFQNDYRHLMADEELADLNIQTRDGRNFKAHKCVFKFRAPKFFQEHYDDLVKSNVDLTIIHSNIFQSMLSYIYTGEADELADKNLYYDLYYAAAEYELKGLQRFCAKTLARGLSADTLCDVYLLADEHHDEELIMQCKIFMRRHLEELSTKLEWNALLDSRPFLLENVKKIRH